MLARRMLGTIWLGCRVTACSPAVIERERERERERGVGWRMSSCYTPAYKTEQMFAGEVGTDVK